MKSFKKIGECSEAKSVWMLWGGCTDGVGRPIKSGEAQRPNVLSLRHLGNRHSKKVLFLMAERLMLPTIEYTFHHSAKAERWSPDDYATGCELAGPASKIRLYIVVRGFSDSFEMLFLQNMNPKLRHMCHWSGWRNLEIWRRL